MNLTGNAMQWHKLTLNFDGPNLSESPDTFMDHRLDVVFTHSSGETVTVPGYFAADGNAGDSGATEGSVWKVHFNAPREGEWTWEAAFRTGDEIAVKTIAGDSAGYFDGDRGGFSIDPTDKIGDDMRAKGVLEYDGGQYLSHAGTGETFLKSGVGSPENFLAYSGFDDTPDSHDYDPHLADYNAGDPTWDGGKGKEIIGAVNYLSEHDVNSVYMMLMNIGGDGRDVSPWADDTLYNINKNPGFVDLEERAQVFDVSKLDQWEIVFGHMQEKGINLHLFLQETENDHLLNDGDLGPERMLFMREMVARFGHHNGIIWNLGEENTNSASQIADHSEYLKFLDPYDHAVTLHTYPGQYDRFEAHEGSETLDAYSFQTSGDTQVPDLDRYLGGAEDAGRPVVAFLDEPGNASIGMSAEGDNGWENNHDNLRETLWKFYAEGGSGAEWYYGYQTQNGQGGDLAMEDFSTRESAYEWAASAREFFEKLPLEDMRDGDNLMSSAETHGLALDGQVYAYYLPKGGTAQLDLTGVLGTYKIGWYDVIDGGDFKAGSVETVSGGSTRSLGKAPDSANGEWAVMIWNEDTFDFTILPGGGSGGIDTPTPPHIGDDIEVILRLVDTETDETISTLEAGDEIDPSVIGSTKVSIVAEVSDAVGSVRLSLGDWAQTENVAPYALFGDVNGDFKDAPNAPFATDGAYSLKVELFDGANGSGKISDMTTEFSVGEDDGSGGGDTPTPPVASEATWVADDGLIVMQAEKGVPSDRNNSGNTDWNISDDLGGHTGLGYLHWEGPNLYSQPGSGALSYEFEVTEEGDYKLGLLGSRPKNGEASDLNNDFWVRMDGGDWTKVFFSGARETWNWGRTFDANHTKSSAEYDLEPGVHILEISGRSENAYLDKIHLSLGTLNTDKSAPETLTPVGDGDDPDPVNLAPVLKNADIALAEDGSLIIQASDVATDPEGGTLTISVVSGPANGSLSQDGAGALKYAPDQNFNGAENAVVEVADVAGNSIEITINLDVAAVNDDPDAGIDSGGNVTAGETFELPNLLVNDTDVDGDTLSILSVSPNTQGFFAELLINSNGTVVGKLADDASGLGTFVYTIGDGNGGTDSATGTITAIAPDEPDAPDDQTPPVDDDLITAINIGSNDGFLSQDGIYFAADTTGVGNRYASDGEISGTEDDLIYNSEAWGANGLNYAFDVQNGDYDVRLHFAEIWNPAHSDGVRVFDIASEGTLLVDDLDVHAASGARTAHTIDLDISVTDGELNLDLLKGIQNPKLSAIEIWRDNDADDVPDTPVDDGTEVWLVDSESDSYLFELGIHTILHEGVVAGRSLSLAAQVDEDQLAVESAVLTLDDGHQQTENVEPYALFGDIEGDFREGAMSLETGSTRAVGIDYYSQDKASGDLLASDEVAISTQGQQMSGRADEVDLFVVDSNALGAVTISNYETSDSMVTLDEGEIDIAANGVQVGDDWVLDFGDGNTLTLEDYAKQQMEREALEELEDDLVF